MIGWNACLQEPFSWLRWMECHPATASYLQILGVVLAIIGSVVATRWSTAQMLKPVLNERFGRAQMLVFRLLPPVIKIKNTVVRVREVFQQTESGMLLAVEDRLDQAVRYFRIDAILPPDVLDQIHVFDEKLAETISKLYFAHSEYNEFVDRNVPLLRQFDGEDRGKFITTFTLGLDAVDKVSNEAFVLLKSAKERKRW